MFRSLRVVVACWLGALPALPALGNEAERGRPFLEVFAPGDYHGHQQVFDIVQSAAGLVYFSNFGAVMEYDGAKWRGIPVPTAFIRQIAADAAGQIWVGGVEELGWCEPGPDGVAVYHSLLDRLPAECRPLGTVWTVQWHDGSAWFATDRQVLRWHNGQFEHWEFAAGIWPRLRHDGKNLWLSCRGDALRRWSGREWQVVSRAPEIKDHWVNVIVDGWTDGATLVGADDGRLWTLGADGTVAAFAPGFSVPGTRITAGTRLRSGWLALATNGRGVVVLDAGGRLVQQLAAEEGLPSAMAYCVTEDREGGVWIGTSMGAARVELGSPYSFFGRAAGASSTVALSIKRNNGVLYIGSEEGVRRLVPDAGAKARFELVPEGGARVFSLLPFDDSLLVGTEGGLALVSGGRERLEVRTRLPVLGLGRSTSSPERIFAGLPDSIVTYRRTPAGDWIDEGPVAGFAGEARTLMEVEAGELWAGTTQHGFARISKGAGQTWQTATVEFFRSERGLPPRPGWVRILAGAGGPWFSTAQGVFVFDRERKAFEPVPAFAAAKLTGLYSFPVAGVKEDEIWAQIAASSEPSDLERPVIGRLVRSTDRGWSWQPLPARIVKQVGYFGAYEMLAEPGTLWLTGQSAIVRIETDRLTTAAPASPPPLRWRRIARGDVGLLSLQGPPPSLPHSRLPLRFEFTRLSFSAGSAHEYSYRLRGYNEAWSDWRTQPELELTGVPAGHYTMEIRARDLPDNPAVRLSYGFSIRPPWYAAPGLLALYGVGALVMVAGVIRWRLAALRRTGARLEQLVAERTRALHEASQRAESANQAKSLFLANASHELRTPLHAILGYTQLLESDRTLSAPAHDRLRIVGASGRQLLRLINEVLDLSKIEAGKQELQIETFDLANLLAEVIEAQETRAHGKGLELRRPDSAQVPGLVRGDAPKLRQVLENLIGNAIAFTGQGVVALAVTPLDGDRIRFEVTDTGPGIAAGDLPRLFQPFEQAGNQPLPAERGTGLGLAITQRLVALMGAEVHLSSEVGRGSRFWFDLALPRVSAPAPAEVPPPVGRSEHRGQGRRVLVVDDIAVNRELLRELLEPVGYAVEVAGNAAEAHAALARANFDLMILDLRLPGTSGLELAGQLRASPATARLPILAASASALGEDPAAALAAGCNDFVAKPFLAEDLLGRISRLLASEPGMERRGFAARAGSMVDLSSMQRLHAAARVGDVVRLRDEIRRLRSEGVTGPILDEVERRARAFDVDGVAAITANPLPLP